MFRFKSAGTLHCPRCFCMREFYVVIGHEADMNPPLECSICEYEFAARKQEHRNGETTMVDPLSPATREAALKKQREEFKENAVASGYRLENFTRGR